MSNKTLTQIQLEIEAWSVRNFGKQPSWCPLLGVTEEVGELSHAYLKRQQGIRGTTEEHNEALRDAVGDIMIYLLDFCGREGINLEDILDETWNQVKQRDWNKNKVDGK
jgi:NTP pyrophosphatase (non-canonical NTP hydrolase)